MTPADPIISVTWIFGVSVAFTAAHLYCLHRWEWGDATEKRGGRSS